MEATLTSYRSSSMKIPPSLVLFTIAMAVLFASYCVYNAHAVARHGSDAEAVRKCLQDNDPYQTWVKPDGRVIHLCHLPDGRWGVQIRDSSGIHEITSLIKNKMSKLSQVEQWLHNMGAERILYP